MITQPEPVRPESGLHMHWHGRRSYRSRVPAPRVLESVPELSHGPASGNMVIEGDNLQVMLSLRSQYSDSFDVVYIDPPFPGQSACCALSCGCANDRVLADVEARSGAA